MYSPKQFKGLKDGRKLFYMSFIRNDILSTSHNYKIKEIVLTFLNVSHILQTHTFKCLTIVKKRIHHFSGKYGILIRHSFFES